MSCLGSSCLNGLCLPGRDGFCGGDRLDVHYDDDDDEKLLEPCIKCEHECTKCSG